MRMRFSRIFQWLNGIYSFAIRSLSLWAPNIKKTLSHQTEKKKIEPKTKSRLKTRIFSPRCLFIIQAKNIKLFSDAFADFRGCCFFGCCIWTSDAGDVAVCIRERDTHVNKLHDDAKAFFIVRFQTNVHENKRQTNERLRFLLLLPPHRHWLMRCQIKWFAWCVYANECEHCLFRFRCQTEQRQPIVICLCRMMMALLSIEKLTGSWKMRCAFRMI